MLMPFGKTLYQATHFYRDYLEKATTSITVNELCDRVAGEFDRRLKGNEFRSNRHHISMNETIRKFRAKFGSVPIKTLKGTTIKAWLALEPLAVKTRNRHLSYIGNIFGIAREWELLDTGPFEKVESFNDLCRRLTTKRNKDIWVLFFSTMVTREPSQISAGVSS
jgi:hypothetical protein